MFGQTLAEILASPRIENTDHGYFVPAGFLGIWVGAGRHFQDLYPINKSSGIDSLIHWWLRAGLHEFPGTYNIISQSLFSELHAQPLQQRASSNQSALDLTPLQAIVSRCRPDIYDSKPLGRPAEEHFWLWWLSDAQDAYNVTSYDCYLAQLHFLFDLASVNKQVSFGDLFLVALHKIGRASKKNPVANSALEAFLEAVHFSSLENVSEKFEPSPFLRLVYRIRSDVRELFDFGSRQGKLDLWSWWHCFGQFELFPETPWIAARTFSSLARRAYPKAGTELDQFNEVGFTQLRRLKTMSFDERTATFLRGVTDTKNDKDDDRAMEIASFVWSAHPELQKKFDINQNADRQALRRWWLEIGWLEYAPSIAHPTRSLAQESILSQPYAASPMPGARRISLVGYPRGEFGLGEDIRLLRNSLQAAGIEPKVIKAPWQITARQAINEEAEDANAADFNSDIMIYVMPAFDCLTLLNKVGTRAFTAHRKIGYWQWELDKFPEAAKIALDLIDEIWCHSEHSAKAFRSATDKPVTKVPLPVFVPKIRNVSRPSLGLDDDNFIIFTSFDGASSISRKNPMGVILAFQQAFPRNRFPHVRLIIKAMNTIDDALWRDCLRKAAIDRRIKVLNKVLDRNEYYELLQSCDAVLSLHRAEGFGRLMAEAMAIGIPVIATAYSGNLDFMTEQNSWLVSGDLSPLIPGDYPFHEGQEWMEPDIAKAAEALRDCYENDDKRKRFVANAKVTIERYSPANCGELYAQFLAPKT